MSSFDDRTVEDRVTIFAGGAGIEAGQLEAIDDEEAAIPDVLAGKYADLLTDGVVGARRWVVAGAGRVPLTPDFEEADRDPDRVLMSTHRGQVCDLLHPLRAEERMLLVAGKPV